MLREIIVSLGPLVVITALICGPLASWLARGRGRNPVLWLIYGALLGPIGVLLAWLAPPGQCVVCNLPTEGWLTTCARHTPSGPTDLTAQAGAASGSTVPGPRPMSPAAVASLVRPITLVAGKPSTSSGPTANPSRTFMSTPVLSEPGILASGVFSGGSERLEVGARYAIARLSDHVRIIGPLDSTPWTVRVDVPLADLVVGTVADRLLLNGAGASGRKDLVLTFQGLAGTHGEELEIALTGAPSG